MKLKDAKFHEHSQFSFFFQFLKFFLHITFFLHMIHQIYVEFPQNREYAILKNLRVITPLRKTRHPSPRPTLVHGFLMPCYRSPFETSEYRFSAKVIYPFFYELLKGKFSLKENQTPPPIELWNIIF